MLRGANDLAQEDDDENSARAEEPDDEINREFFSPCLSDIFTLHSTDPFEEEGGHPPRQSPAHPDPATTRRRFLEYFRRLTVSDLTRQRFFHHEALLVRVLEHVARGRIGLSAVVGVGVVPVTREAAAVVKVIAAERLALIVLIIVQISPLEGGCIGDKRKSRI